MPYNAEQHEQEILKFWDENQTFEKSVSERPDNKPYVFYDGPPFATGLPHYGHFVASVMKDVVPRYWTMRGFRVERVWGWDCHGLPIENIVEKELGTKTKKEIEAMGVAKFNELCRSKVLGYVEEWEKTIKRLGRWVDMEHAYVTMSRDYMESVWWVFKQLWDKNLIYQDYRSMHICPRCETTLSQQEVSEGYKDVKDISVYVKFHLKADQEFGNGKYKTKDSAYILAWTTTPWTLPGNVALAVGEKIRYTSLRIKGIPELLIVASDLVETILKDEEIEIVHDDVLGKDLVGLQYEPLFPYYQDIPNAFRVVAGDFVTTTDGTGIVHIAPGFGEDDFQVGKREQIPMVQHVGMDGRMKPEVVDFAGLEVKPRSDDDKVRLSTDIAVLKYLQEHNLFFKKENIVHSYPHCWRCDTPLLNYATSSWFVKVTAVKDDAIKLAEKINWSPAHIKEGRFGQWLGGARDWSISRQRFWASVMPIWECGERDKKNCEYVVVGSAEELEKLSGRKVDDLHKHVVDEITFPCPNCGSIMKRVPDVLDTWFDSGSMPYAQLHYPFENKAKFEANFPAQFIAEGQDQTRAWFYYVHVLATSLFKKPAYKNVIVNGIVLAEDGKKMSKKLQNYPDPNVILEKYGADALRYYLVTSPVMHAENLNFSESGVREMYNKVVNTLWNVFEFYSLFADNKRQITNNKKSENVLDKWILAKLQLLVRDVTREMEAYNLSEASRPIAEFIDELSTWYVRRSRDRFKGEDEADKASALSTLYHVLMTLTKVMAPFTPFIAEEIFQKLKMENGKGGINSVHLEMWPEVDKKLMDEAVLNEMQIVRKVVEMGLAQRAEASIKVRQPLQQLTVINQEIPKEMQNIVADELNVKEVVCKNGSGELSVALDTKITEELQKEGLARDLVRAINQMRKDKGLTISDKVKIQFESNDELLTTVFSEYSTEISRAVLATELISGSSENGLIVELDGRKVKILIQ